AVELLLQLPTSLGHHSCSSSSPSRPQASMLSFCHNVPVPPMNCLQKP
uniref:Uncharacterized protein n=1 Tax=Mola mola TaxID=94237 RepID=A0A3Q3X0J5_MOLML